MYILGLSCYYHNSAACLLQNGSIIAAVEEERFSRVKNDPRFPQQAIIYCLKTAGIGLKDLDAIVYYEKPFLKLERILERFLESAPFGFRSFVFAIPKWINEKLFFKRHIKRGFKNILNERLKTPIFFSEHHLSHAAQAFFLSPFENAAILTVDAVGEWETASIYKGEGASLQKMASVLYPNSIGLFFSSFTYFLGFEVNEGEYKLMGLAAYGNRLNAKYIEFYNHIIHNLITCFPDGSIQLNQTFFKFEHDLKLIDEDRWEKLFNVKKRIPESPIQQIHADLALAVQDVLENSIMKLGESCKNLCSSDNLCLSGGVSLNGKAMGKITSLSFFKKHFVPFAPGDSGAAIGAALAYYHCGLGFPRSSTLNHNPYLGPEYSNEDIENTLSSSNIHYEILAEKDLCKVIAEKLSSGNIVGWFQGRSEFGPRALGNRSILADPRETGIPDRINSRVKFREEFRPFAPAIVDAEVANYYEAFEQSPYMQYVYDLKNEFRSGIANETSISLNERKGANSSIFPAVTHVDNSARVQTVSPELNPLFHNLLLEFKSLTGHPILLNTSFNKRGEPIVNSPKEALDCFLTSDIDILVLNNFYVSKSTWNSYEICTNL